MIFSFLKGDIWILSYNACKVTVNYPFKCRFINTIFNTWKIAKGNYDWAQSVCEQAEMADLSKNGAAAWQSADSFELPQAARSEGGERDGEDRGLPPLM